MIDKLITRTKAYIAEHHSETLSAYLLERKYKAPQPDDINRVAGAPIGVTDNNWPTFNGRKMAHVLTLDLNTTPDLKSHFAADTRAIALFISDMYENEAFKPGNSETRLIELTESDLEAGVGPMPIAGDYSLPEAGIFRCQPIELPVALFDEDLFDLDEDDPLMRLYEELSEYSLAGGRPLWLQAPEHDGRIILQFDENLVEMNLGDGGLMYVFTDTAFWQCH